MGVRFDNPRDFEEALARNPDLRLDTSNFRYPVKTAVKNPVKNNTELDSLSLPKESEDDFQKWVIKTLQANGWKVAHFRAAMTSRTYTNKAGETKNVWVTPVQADGAGFPDILAINEVAGRVLVLELKSDAGKLSPEQEDWMRHFGLAGITWHVFRPKDREMILRIVEDR